MENIKVLIFRCHFYFKFENCRNNNFFLKKINAFNKILLKIYDSLCYNNLLNSINSLLFLHYLKFFFFNIILKLIKYI